MARQSGQIVKRAENKWLVRISLGYDSTTGERQRFSKTIRGTKKEAQRYLNGVLRDMDCGVFAPPSTMTLGAYLNHWLETSARPKVSRRTADGYAALLERYIRKPLGSKRLDQIKALDIQKVYGEMQSRGLSARVVRHTHTVLKSALKQAVKWGMIPMNQADLADLPKIEHKERRVLSSEEAGSFLTALEGERHGLVFELALLTGMRPEEYLALQWADVNFERGVVSIQRALVRHKGQWSFEQTKTPKSRRSIPLPQMLIRKLKAFKREQAEARLKAGSLWQVNNLVFCSDVGTPLSIPHLTYRYFRPVLRKAGLPQIRLYDLRHSCATLLLEADENPKIVAERLGHATVRLTLDTYSHALPTMQQRATDKLERLLYA